MLGRLSTRSGQWRPRGRVVLNRRSLHADHLVAWWPLGPSNPFLAFNYGVTSSTAARELIRGAHGSNIGLILSTTEMGLAPEKTDSAARLEFSTTRLSSFPLNEASMSFWCKLRNATPGADANTGWPFTLTNATGAADHYPYTDGSVYLGQFRTTRQTITPLSGVTRSQWHLVTLVSRPGTNGWRFFQNARLVYSTTGDASIPAPVATGRLVSTVAGGYSLDGWLVDVRLWNRALSDAEVWTLFDPRTRWDLYQSPTPQVWFKAMVTTEASFHVGAGALGLESGGDRNLPQLGIGVF
jgi:hypothetical protein